MHRFLALGDSYTFGEGVAEAERWPNQLTQLLRARQIALDDPELIARTAWTSDELSDAIAGLTTERPYDLVSLLVGVNDQYRGRAVQSFVGGFSQLLRRARTLAGRRPSRVIAISIPDWGATPFAEGRDRELIAREIDAYNERARDVTKSLGAHWVNLTDISRRMRADASLIAPDGLHPSGRMYREWAEIILPIAESVLSARSS